MTRRPFSYAISGDARTLTLRGELDEAAAVELRDLLNPITADLVGELRVDLTDVDFLPSAAVGVLASAQSGAARGNGSIAFVAASGSTAQRVLTICGLPHDAA
jgi:anti-anti-sigma factor